jgi:ankyrin repeat protein
MKNYAHPQEHAELLIRHGADINAQDAHGDTILHCLWKDFRTSWSNLVTVLLQLGGNPNIQNSRGETCLHTIRYNEYDYNAGRNVIHSIMDANASLDIYNHNGRTPLLAAVEKSIEYSRIFLDHVSKPSVSKRTLGTGKSALHLACKLQEPKRTIELLLENGANPLCIDNKGNTLLHELATVYNGSSQQVDLLRTLVQLGVSVHTKNFRGQTAAHILPRTNVGANGAIPLYTQQHSFIRQLLSLDKSLDVNEQDFDGHTALHYAASYSEAQAYSLISAGATLDLKSYKRRTPLHCAARGRQSTIIAMLLNSTSQRGTPIDVDLVDADGRTPLHDACRSGMPESVRILIDAGANVNKKNKMKRTPLMVCSEFMSEKARWCSLQKELDYTTDKHNEDDFRHPVAHNQVQEIARIGVIAKMLIEAGANTAGALQLALSTHCADLVVSIRATEVPLPLKDVTKSSGNDSEDDEDEMVNVLDFRSDVYNTPGGFWETFLSFPSARLAEVFKIYKDKDPKENLVDFIPSLNEEIIDLMIAVDQDCIDGTSPGLLEPCSLGKIASLGLTEYMDKVVDRAKHLDDPNHFQLLRKRDDKDIQCRDCLKVRPILQDACGRPFWNMDMVRLLVERGGVDVNAHQQIIENKFQYDEVVISGPTALHLLARGNSHWNIEAIEYLLENGKFIYPKNESEY